VRKSDRVIATNPGHFSSVYLEKWLTEGLNDASRVIMPLPVEIDLGIIAVLRLAGVASGECAEEGVGQKTGYLLLRQSQRMIPL